MAGIKAEITRMEGPIAKMEEELEVRVSKPEDFANVRTVEKDLEKVQTCNY